MTAGLGLAHATAPRYTFSFTVERRIARRWEYWKATALVFARREHVISVEASVASLKARHREAILATMNANISWRVVCECCLDNPFYSDAHRAAELQGAIARRESRLGRIKGVTRRRRRV